MIDGNGLMWHRLLSYLVQRLTHMIMMIQWVLMHLLAHADLVVGVQSHEVVLRSHHHWWGHRNLRQGLPSCWVLGQIDHAWLLALSAVGPLLLSSCPKVGHCSAAVALAGDHIDHALLLASHAVGSLGRPWYTKAGHCLAAVAGAGPDVDHASLLALSTVGRLLLTSVCKVGLRPSTETLAWCGTHIDHVISLAPCTVSGFRYAWHGIARPGFATDTLLDLHHARLSVSHAVRWPAAACHGKGCQIATSAQGRIHGRQVLWLDRLQGLKMVRNAYVRHVWSLIAHECCESSF